MSCRRSARRASIPRCTTSRRSPGCCPVHPTPARTTSRETYEPLSELTQTLGEYYQDKRKRYEVRFPFAFDRALRRTYARALADDRRPRAAHFLRRNRLDLFLVDPDVARRLPEHEPAPALPAVDHRCVFWWPAIQVPPVWEPPRRTKVCAGNRRR